MDFYTPTPAEMERHIARFASLTPTSERHQKERGLPAEIYQTIAAKRTWNLMSPANLGGNVSPTPPVVIDHEGVFRLGMVACPAGNGPTLHAHTRTHETFMAMSGRWEITWGDQGEHSTVLEQFDLIDVPPRVFRAFRNVSDSEAYLLVVIHGKAEDFGDTYHPPQTAQMVEQRFGAEALETVKQRGIRFLDEARMRERRFTA